MRRRTLLSAGLAALLARQTLAAQPPKQRGAKGERRVLPAIAAAREAARRSESANHIKELVTGLLNYHDVHDCFPPAVVLGPDGRPWHSWRILLAPFLEGGRELYERYDFGLPWDDERNLAIASTAVRAHTNPLRQDEEPGLAGYAAIGGPGTLFEDREVRMESAEDRRFRKAGTPLARIRDGASRTVALAALAAERRIAWTQPGDLSIGAAMEGGLAAEGFEVLPGRDGAPDQVLVAFCDGTVRTVPADAPSLRALATIDADDAEPPPGASGAPRDR